MADETRKMLGADLSTSAPPACGCRCSTPTPESIQIETSERRSPPTPSATCSMVAPGVVLVDEPALGRYPAAREAAGPRRGLRRPHPRRTLTPPTAWLFWCVSDNLRKGAATNAVQIAESLVTRGWL